jgi:DNA-binding NarL/FixJ family response regulator
MTVRVVVADDQPLIRAGLRGIIESEPGFTVVAEAADGEQAVAAAKRDDVDVVLMDLGMPVVDGVEAILRIRADPASAGVPVLVLTTFETEDDVLAAVSAGANGYLGKQVEPDSLLNALMVVARGETLLSAGALAALAAQLRPSQPSFAATSSSASTRSTPSSDVLAVLTEREREVALLVAKGLSNNEIGRRLFISPATAKTHVNRAMSKLGARDRAQLVVVVHSSGAVPPTP